MKNPTFLPGTMQNHAFFHPGYSIHSSLPTQPSHVHLLFEVGPSSKRLWDQNCRKQQFLRLQQAVVLASKAAFSKLWSWIFGIGFTMIPSIIFLGWTRTELWGLSTIKLKRGNGSLGNIHKLTLSPEFQQKSSPNIAVRMVWIARTTSYNWSSSSFLIKVLLQSLVANCHFQQSH